MDQREESRKTREGVFASIAGLVCNLALASAKLVVGILSGLVSVVADGINNLSDGGSCLVSLLSFRIASKPADKEHPYGHQRAEYVSSLLIGVLVIVAAVGLFRESFGRLFEAEIAEVRTVVLIVLIASVFVKAGMFFFYRLYAKKTGSDILRAAAIDSACDCLATLAALIGAVLLRRGISADGWVGILVAAFILWQGFKILMDASSKLLGQAPPPEFLSSIKERILQESGVLGLHDLRVYPYGPHKIFATVHIETDANEQAIVSHERLDKIERMVKTEFGVELTAHLDPVVLDDLLAQELEKRIRAAIEGMVEDMDIHDFRVVSGAKTKIIFEVGVPFACKRKDAEIENDICRAVKILGDYEPVITIERE